MYIRVYVYMCGHEVGRIVKRKPYTMTHYASGCCSRRCRDRMDKRIARGKK